MNAMGLLDRFVSIGESACRASWQAAVLAGMVLVVQVVVGRRIAPRWRHAMWALVFVRLAMPTLPSSPVSVFNLTPENAAGIAFPSASKPDVAPSEPISNGSFAVDGRSRATSVPPESPVTPVVDVAVVHAPAQQWWNEWPRMLTAVWLAGIFLLAGRVGWATWQVARTIRRLDRDEDSEILHALQEAAADLRVRRVPHLLTGDDLFSPALVGFIRPKLLLPRDILVRLEPAELRLVLAHELAHLKRRDVLVNWVVTLLTVMHWPNPVVWLAAWRLRVERELATDELVLSSTTNDADRKTYGHTILTLLESLPVRTHSNTPAVPIGGLGILEGKQQMKRRITMIARFAKRSRAWTVVAASLVLGIGLVALTDAAEKPVPTKSGADAAKTPTTAPASAVKADTADIKTDYILGPNDLLQVTLFGLEGAGLQTIKSTRVSGTGNITMPYMADPVHVGGMTALAARDEIAKAYEKAGVLNHAKESVSVEVVEMRNRPRAKPEIAADELIIVSVMDLVGPGVESVRTVRPDDEGNIRLAYVGEMKAVGLKPIDLEKAIAKAYHEKGVLEKALVVVSLPDRGESHRLASKATDQEVDVPVQPQAIRPERTRRVFDVSDLLGDDEKKGGEELRSLLMGNVEPDSWMDNGGMMGSMTVFQRKLVVTTEPKIVEDVALLLETLRTTPGRPTTKPAVQPK